MTQLLNILSRISTIPNINFGGCGIVAIAIYRWLKKNNFSECTYFLFLYSDTDEKDYLNNSDALNVKDVNKATAPRHIIISNENHTYIDSHGIRGIQGYRYKHIVLNEKFVVNLINDISKWNDLFNRNNIKDIEELFNVDLSDIAIYNMTLCNKINDYHV